MSEFHERLRKAREAARYETATDAAKAMGVPAPTYMAHENGSRGGKTRANGDRYSRFFRVSYNWLMTGRGSMKKPVEDPLADLTDDQRIEAERYIEYLRNREKRA